MTSEKSNLFLLPILSQKKINKIILFRVLEAILLLLFVKIDILCY